MRSRFDAVTCSETCRQRLHRGGDLAYLADLTPKEQRIHRDLHAALDASREAEKKARAANLTVRGARQRARRAKIEGSICARLKLEELLEGLAAPNHSDAAAEG